MRRKGLGLVLAGAGAVLFSSELPGRIQDQLKGLEIFELKEVEVSGLRYLSREEVLTTLGMAPGTNLWEDLSPYRERLRAHPLVEGVVLRRRLPGTLAVEVRERAPVAFLADPVLSPVDREGRPLPLDPVRLRLDAPILVLWDERKQASLGPSERRTLASEVARLEQMDPGFVAKISTISLSPRGDLRVEIWEPPLTIFLRPGISADRLDEAMRVLADAKERFPDSDPWALDLRFEDQVVVRLQGKRGS